MSTIKSEKKNRRTFFRSCVDVPCVVSCCKIFSSDKKNCMPTFRASRDCVATPVGHLVAGLGLTQVLVGGTSPTSTYKHNNFVRTVRATRLEMTLWAVEQSSVGQGNRR